MHLLALYLPLKNKTFSALTSCLFIAISSSAFAHEYWLDPIDAVVAINEDVIVDIRNGQNFSGAAFPFDPDRIERISISNTEGREAYKGRLGDYPAINFETNTLGLHSIEVDSKPTELVYDSWEKFTEFLDYHGFENVAEEHVNKGYSKLDVTERYVRSAKTLIVVADDNEATDAQSLIDTQSNKSALSPNGALFEIILLKYPPAESKTVEFQLLYEGKPVANRQVEMFWNGIKGFRRTAISNNDGIASFALVGKGNYMLNAVQLVEPKKNSDVNWLSYWASITFERY